MGDRISLDREVEELFRAKMREFITFCRDNWLLTDSDMAELHASSSPEYRDGYNAAMTDGIDGAFALWAEEEF